MISKLQRRPIENSLRRRELFARLWKVVAAPAAALAGDPAAGLQGGADTPWHHLVEQCASCGGRFVPAGGEPLCPRCKSSMELATWFGSLLVAERELQTSPGDDGNRKGTWI